MGILSKLFKPKQAGKKSGKKTDALPDSRTVLERGEALSHDQEPCTLPPVTNSVVEKSRAASMPDTKTIPCADGKSREVEPPDDEEVSYRLAMILPLIPQTLLQSAPQIEEGMRITVPFRLIEPQLAGGKVELAFDVFLQALPDRFKSHFAAAGGNENARIPVPLSEVIPNLPGVDPLPAPRPTRATPQEPSPDPAAIPSGKSSADCTPLPSERPSDQSISPKVQLIQVAPPPLLDRVIPTNS